MPTTVAPVKYKLVTTVVPRSLSAALMLLLLYHLSMIILSSDFAAERIFTRIDQVKATCFQLKQEQKKSRKAVTVKKGNSR